MRPPICSCGSRAASRHLPPVLIGSHIDSQPTGGKFDGAYGVVAALEAAQAIAELPARPRRSIEVVAWMNEEGSRFAPGMMGSAVFTGKRNARGHPGRQGSPTGHASGRRSTAVLGRRAGAAAPAAGFPVAALPEAHIEQGTALQERQHSIGIVTGIQGKRTFRVEITGEESHAGTTPRGGGAMRWSSAVAIVDALQKAMWDEADTVRFTIGMFNVTPNAPVGRAGQGGVLHRPAPQRAHGDRSSWAMLVAGTCASGRAVRCEVKVTELLYDVPLQFPAAIRARLGETARRRSGCRASELPSPAGHDSRYLHYVCPTGMIFIPCKDGISHNEAESITPADATAGARVLAEAAFELANQ